MDELTPEEFDTLRAFNLLESFGDEREDLRAFVMTANLMSCWTKDRVDPLDLQYLNLPENQPATSHAAKYVDAIVRG